MSRRRMMEANELESEAAVILWLFICAGLSGACMVCAFIVAVFR